VLFKAKWTGLAMEVEADPEMEEEVVAKEEEEAEEVRQRSTLPWIDLKG